MSNRKETEKIRNRYSRISGMYDILEKPMESLFSNHRRDMLKEVSGKVLEVGVGTGKNLEYYPDDVEITAIDFSPKMIEKAKEKANKIDREVRILEMDAENMDFEDSTFDSVVTSCVFCSVPDPVKGLKEIRRVCKTGGNILMLEHVKSNNSLLAPVMEILNPIPLIIYGANINRNTIENLKEAGFENITVKDLWLDILKLIIIKNEK